MTEYEEALAIARAVTRSSPIRERAGAMLLGTYMPDTAVEAAELHAEVRRVSAENRPVQAPHHHSGQASCQCADARCGHCRKHHRADTGCSLCACSAFL